LLLIKLTTFTIFLLFLFLFYYFCYLFLLVLSLFLYDRDATDSYSIAAAPNLESIIRAPSVIYSSFIGLGSKSYLEHDERTSFLSGEELAHAGITRRQSTWWEKASIKQIPEEFPIEYGCSLSQTIFNGWYFKIIIFNILLICLSKVNNILIMFKCSQ